MYHMKRLLPGIVLLFSLSAATVYVWKSSQKDKVNPTVEKNVEDKAKGDFVEPKIVVTDEEVRATRELMLSSSKSGLIMSEEDVRKMLEEKKKAEIEGPPVPLAPDVNDLASSSKNPNRAITRDDIKKILESRPQQEQPTLPPP